MTKRYLCAKYKELLIPPAQFHGGVFLTDDPELQDIIERSHTFSGGAIDVFDETPEETVEIPVPGEPIPPDAPAEKSLSQRSKDDLIQIAYELGIKVEPDSTRADIYQAIKAHKG